MGWWSIVKSSREEAYDKFIEEFGPGVKLDSLKLSEDEQDNIYLPGDKWYIKLEEGKISFRSRLGHEAFVEGMFKEEYPERYQELLEMVNGAPLTTNHEIPLDVINRYLECMKQIQKYLVDVIANEYSDNTLSKRDVMMALALYGADNISPTSISRLIDMGLASKTYGPDLNLEGGEGLHVMVHSIATVVSNRTLNHPFVQELKPSDEAHFRERLQLAYYDLYGWGISDNDFSNPVFYSASHLADQIDYVIKILSGIYQRVMIERRG